MKTVCDLQSRRVRARDGTLLGHAFDFRCAWQQDALVVTHLVYGRRGLLERLGFRERRVDTLPWSAVVSVEEREIVVETTRRR